MDADLKELQDPATWDDEHDEILPGANSPRVIVPVAFDADDFARVAEDAHRHRMPTAAFIRAMAVGRLDHESEAVATGIAEPRSVAGGARRGGQANPITR